MKASDISEKAYDYMKNWIFKIVVDCWCGAAFEFRR